MAHAPITITALLMLALAHSSMSVTVQELFPDVKNNLTLVKWSHAINNKNMLNAALASNETMMIEADVVLGILKTDNNSTPPYPVMGHPPHLQNLDLSLEEFLKHILDAHSKENKKVGMKLDFKSIEAFEASIDIVKKHNITVPLWVNADILEGPVNATTANGAPLAVNAKLFLDGAAKLPQALLSIGWTTRVLSQTGLNATYTGNYTLEQANIMISKLQDSKTNQSVTYPVRACFVANDDKDTDVLGKLLTNSSSNNPTLTVWSAVEDKNVNATKLSEVIKRIGVEKVYLDVPEELYNKLSLNSAINTKNSKLIQFSSLLLAAIASLRIH
ncbi:protein FAM151B [Trichogramma pretiosum]|uniref:protein FAM151B n=1 Tax=Trichogramma pretiosum TaxID=7493 RepID=UPI0006C9438D|nr:protein FAM151B [Trichogramma pretiosum]